MQFKLVLKALVIFTLVIQWVLGVDVTSPDEFLEAYKNANNTERSRMTGAFKKSKKPDKIINNENSKKTLRLIYLEDVKSHVESIEKVAKLKNFKYVKESLDGDPKSNSTADFRQRLQSDLDMITPGVILSSNTISQLIAETQHTSSVPAEPRASYPFDNYFFEKTIINGLSKQDEASLAFLGAKVVSKNLQDKVGEEYFSEAKKWGDLLSKLGTKIRIPGVKESDCWIFVVLRTIHSVGVRDIINLSADAVDHIASGAINIVVEAASAIVPVAAPVFKFAGNVVKKVVGFLIGWLQGPSHDVPRVSTEVLLHLGFDPDIYRRDYANVRHSFIADLLKDKKANNMAVQHSLKFLNDNDNFLGIVFPSRTLQYHGPCEMYKRYCAAHMFGKCLNWAETWHLLESGCERGGPCSKDWGACVTHNVANYLGRRFFECRCGDGKGKTTFGYPQSNSLVDFTKQQWVYWDASVPDDIENGQFQCKPGDLNKKPKLSQDHPILHFLCNNAIGLIQPDHKRHSGQVMLFNLEDGHDTVVQNGKEDYPSIFRMGENGAKFFTGSGGGNDFIFDSNCGGSLSGSIYGAPDANDRIIVANSCARGKLITIDIQNGKMISDGNNLVLQINSIEEALGREGDAETFQVNCHTKEIRGGGGKSSPLVLDQVRIPYDSFCRYNIVVFGTSYTLIKSSASNGDVNIPIDSIWIDLQLELDIHPKDLLRQQVLFLKTSSSQLTEVSFGMQGNQIWVAMRSSGNHGRFTFNMLSGVSDASMYFTETPDAAPPSVLYLSLDHPGTAVFYHYLPNIYGNRVRRGCRYTKNVFEISASWEAIGGDKSDEFVLNFENGFSIDGGAGEDTITIHPDLKSSVKLLQGIINIENIYGRNGVPLTLWTTCDMKIVATQGGSAQAPDVVNIPTDLCHSRKMQVFVNGNTLVILHGGRQTASNNDVIQVVADATEQSNVLTFELFTKTAVSANLFVYISVSHRNWRVVNTWGLETVSIHLEGVSEEGRIDFVKFGFARVPTQSGPYVNIPYVQISVGEKPEEGPGLLIIDSETLIPKLLYTHHGSMSAQKQVIKGLVGIESLFKLTAADGNWEAIGGNLKDVFIVTTTASHQGTNTIDGGGGDHNTVILENGNGDPLSIFLVNLVNPQFSYFDTPSGKSGKVRNIHHVVGRAGSPEIISPDCNTKTIDGRGGHNEEYPDIIQIGIYSCRFDLELTVGRFSNIQNSARTGTFLYNIEDVFTTFLEIQPRKQTKHILNFKQHPREFLKTAVFNNTTQIMEWQIAVGPSDRILQFPMWRESDKDEYSNPSFQFNPTESSVKSDIRIGADGTTMATMLVHDLDKMIDSLVGGLPVHKNRFVIDIKKKRINGGKIQGCTDSSVCKTNQFWILNLEPTLEELDGGGCLGCSNFIHFTSNPRQVRLEVDLDIHRGYIRAENGQSLVSKLKNIHILVGTSAITAFPACSTSLVSNVETVVVKAGSCPFNLSVGLRKETRVVFEEMGQSYHKHSDKSSGSSSIFHYIFTEPMSFMLEGNLRMINQHTHYYILSVSLNTLRSVRFDMDEDALSYGIGEIEYNLPMINPPAHYEQFYSQPIIKTADGYKLQVSRDGTIWAILANSSMIINIKSMSALQQLANNLLVTLVIQTTTDFAFVGYTTSEGDRNVLQNLQYVNSHLAGGGADDTIYDISYLNNDVHIHTGFSKDAFDNYVASGKRGRQTIDLTNIAVQIRRKSRTKYVPTITENGKHIVISMEGFQDLYPGKIILVNGGKTWVSKRIQFLLNNVMMELDSTADQKFPRKKSNKQKRSVDNSDSNQWIMHPSPLIIPEDVTIYHISPEDLEDGQEIRLQQAPSKFDDHLTSTSNSDVVFNVARNGTDFYITNVGTLNQSYIKTVIIDNFYESTDENQLVVENAEVKMPVKISELKINFPGLHLMINNSNVMNLSYADPTNENSNGLLAEVMEWTQVLYEVEAKLLDDMPEITRSFLCEHCQPWWRQQNIRYFMSGIFFILVTLLILIGLIVLTKVSQKDRTYEYSIVKPRTGKNDPIPETVDDDGQDLELVKMNSLEVAAGEIPNTSQPNNNIQLME